MQPKPYEPHYRENVIRTLRLLASRDAQLAYQQRVPIAQVSAELFCQWADDCFDSADRRLQDLFSPVEWQALIAFHERFERISDLVPSPLPSIHEFVRDPLWQQLADAARDALKAFPDEHRA